jgi:glycosyltransferase involved in cell wall biosynthesis
MPTITPVGDSSRPPDCMVVIPARNEAATIARTVHSLPHDTVIVVDDFSADATADIARKAGAGVLPAPKLPPGALGKPNACMEGARVLTSRWILFADADTWFEPGFLEAAVSAAEAAPVDFLSIHLDPVYPSFGAALVGPIAAAFFFFGVNPRRQPASAFNGQCVLVRRDPYEFVGGHKALLTQVFDDVKLAELAARHRMKFALARAGGLGHVRIYIDSIRRGAHRCASISPWIGIRILLALLLSVLWAGSLIWLGIAGQRIPLALSLILGILFLEPWYGPLRALLAPFGVLAAIPVMASATLHVLTGRHVEWKGRVI